MVNYFTKISSHYQVLIYFAMFHEKPAGAMPPGTKVVWMDQQIVLVHDNLKTIQAASHSLKNQLKLYYLNLYTGKSFNSNQQAALDQLREEIEMTQLNLNDFKRLLKKVSDFGNDKVSEFFHEKIAQCKTMTAFILKESDKEFLDKALKAENVGLPAPESYIVRHDELMLNFDEKQLIRLQLLDVYSSIGMQYEDLRLEGRNNKLYVVGPKKSCYNFKKFADQMLTDNQILLVDIYDPSVNEKISQLNKKMPSWLGAKVFTSDQVLAFCQELQGKYKLDEPVKYIANLIKSKRLFIMLYCAVVHAEATQKFVKNELGLDEDQEYSDNDEPVVVKPSPASKTRSSRIQQVEKPREQPKVVVHEDSDNSDGPKITLGKKSKLKVFYNEESDTYNQRYIEEGYQIVGDKRKPEKSFMKKQIASRIVMLNEYDEKDMRAWFSKNQHIDVQNLMTVDGQDTVTVILLGAAEDKGNPKLIGPFEMYFSYNKVTFFKEEQINAARNEMKAIQQKNPNYNIQFLQGFGPYRFAELTKPENIKRQMGLIFKKNTKEGGKNIHRFQCVLFTGLHNLGNMIERRIKDAINDEARQLEHSQDWQLKLQPVVSEATSNPKLKELVEKKMAEEINKSQCLKINSVSWSKEEVTVKVIPAPGSSRPVIEMIKKNLKEIVQVKLCSKLLEVKVSMSDLQSFPEIDKDRHIFVYKKEGIFLIGFEVENEIHRINSIIQSKKIEQVIKAGLYLEPMLREHLKKLIEQHKDSLTFSSSIKGDQIHIEIKGLVSLVKLAALTLKNRIEQLEEETQTFQFVISQEDSRVTKEYNLLEIIEKEFIVKATICSSSHQDLELTLPRGKLVLTQRRSNLILGTNHLLLVFNEKDMHECSTDGYYPKFSEELCVFDSQEKVGFLRNMKYLNKSFKNFKKGVKLVLYPPEDKSLREFFIDVIEELKAYDSEESFYVYACARNSDNPSSEYKQLEKEIRSKKLQRASTAPNIIWSWELNAVKTPYSPQAQAKINKAFSKNEPTLNLNEEDLIITEPTHTFNKASSTLTHLLTDAVTKVVKLSPIFYKFDGKFGTMQIPTTQIAKIDASKDNEVPVILVLYQLDLINMLQTNLYTGFQRKLVKEGNVAPKPTNPLDGVDVNPVEHRLSVVEIKCHVSCNADTESKIIDRLKMALNRLRSVKDTLEVDSKQISEDDLRVLCDENGVDMAIASNNGNTLIVRLNAYNAKDIEIIKHKCEIKKLSFVKAADVIEYPSTWVNGPDDIMLYEVPKNTVEYMSVYKDFKIGPIKRLIRVENKLIWKKYVEEKKDLEYITGQAIKELNLFHGTRDHDPSGVYHDKEEAFNINYSGENNYFGRGIYFAQEASYSKNYAHPDGRAALRTMLYCRVLVGTSQELTDKDRSKDLRDTGIRDNAKKIKYQSVHSKYDGSDIYIVYKSRRAYPSYVIEF